jgi:hypothetical protein
VLSAYCQPVDIPGMFKIKKIQGKKCLVTSFNETKKGAKSSKQVMDFIFKSGSPGFATIGSTSGN